MGMDCRGNDGPFSGRYFLGARDIEKAACRDPDDDSANASDQNKRNAEFLPA